MMDTEEHLQHLDINMFVHREEQKDAQLVNTMRSEPLKESLQSAKLLKYLYKEAGVEIEENSLCTDNQELSSVYNSELGSQTLDLTRKTTESKVES